MSMPGSCSAPWARAVPVAPCGTFWVGRDPEHPTGPAEQAGRASPSWAWSTGHGHCTHSCSGLSVSQAQNCCLCQSRAVPPALAPGHDGHCGMAPWHLVIAAPGPRLSTERQISAEDMLWVIAVSDTLTGAVSALPAHTGFVCRAAQVRDDGPLAQFAALWFRL